MRWSSQPEIKYCDPNTYPRTKLLHQHPWAYDTDINIWLERRDGGLLCPAQHHNTYAVIWPHFEQPTMQSETSVLLCFDQLWWCAQMEWLYQMPAQCMRAYMHMLAGSNTTILELLSGKNGGRCCKKTKHTLTLPCPSGCCNWGGYGRPPVDQQRSHIAGREWWGSGLAMGINVKRHAYASLILVLTLSMASEDSTLKVKVMVSPVRRQGQGDGGTKKASIRRSKTRSTTL